MSASRSLEGGGSANFTTTTVTISNGTSLSPAVDCQGLGQLVGIIMPAAWTAAGLSFQGSIDNVTFADMFDGAGSGSAIAYGVQPSRFVCPGPTELVAPFMKFRSGTSGVPVVQAADRILTLIFVL